ncbi:HD domain-containing protein [Nonomuraea lactucae]|uniref:HD domain-containing protein n=1 Tax=Nonomuraea lactucae TaxID=2249762 RepID=UPI000DE30AD6|nr:HD domain-containing protein [Nonomuraea lactucae]
METFTSWKSWEGAEGPLSAALPADTVDALREAVAFATLHHGPQRRPTGVPYLEHLLEALEVAVAGAGVTDPDVLVAIVLHDVVEDTACTRKEIEERFGEQVAELVGWVTKPRVADGQDKAAVKAAYLRSLAGAPEPALLVKLADRVSNVQELHRMPTAFQRRYHGETVAHVVPLATRLAGEWPWFARWFAAWRAEWRSFDPDPA